MREETTRLITILDETVSGEGSVVSTRSNDNSQADWSAQAGTSERARLFLNVTALTAGSSPTLDVDIVHVIDTIDFVVGSFTQATAGASFETVSQSP